MKDLDQKLANFDSKKFDEVASRVFNELMDLREKTLAAKKLDQNDLETVSGFNGALSRFVGIMAVEHTLYKAAVQKVATLSADQMIKEGAKYLEHFAVDASRTLGDTVADIMEPVPEDSNA